MYKVFLRVLIFSAIGICFCVSINAQADASTSSGRPRPEEPLPKSILENVKKMEAERSKRDYDDMLKNGEEAVKLSEEVELSFEKNSKFSSDDFIKLERIEKLLKKIRNEMGGGGDDEKNDEKNSLSIKNAVSSLKSTVITLYGELKKTSRFSISVAAVQSSNSLLSIVRFLRIRRK